MKIAKAMRKQSSEVKEKWENLNTSASIWQKQVDKALEKLKDLQCAMDDLDADLKEAENVRNGWKPVGDLLIDSLPDHIEKTTVSVELQENIWFICVSYLFILVPLVILVIYMLYAEILMCSIRSLKMVSEVSSHAGPHSLCLLELYKHTDLFGHQMLFSC